MPGFTGTLVQPEPLPVVNMRMHELESGKAMADLEKISDARDLARRAYDGRDRLFTRHWIIH